MAMLPGKKNSKVCDKAAQGNQPAPKRRGRPPKTMPKPNALRQKKPEQPKKPLQVALAPKIKQ